MSTATVDLTPLTRDQVAALITKATAERDAGIAQAEDNASDWDKALIDQAIGWFAQTGQPFSANDVRQALPDDINCRGLMGARFSAAYTLKLIRPVGERPSLKQNTHCKRINVWVSGAEPDEETQP